VTPQEIQALVDAERSIVGAVFLQPDLVEAVALEPEQFFDPRCRYVWAAFRELQSAATPIDTVTTESALAAASKLDAVGGASHLAELAMLVPTTSNVEHYVAIVRDAAMKRAVSLAISDVLVRIKSGSVSGEEALSEALAALSRIDGEQPDDAVSIGELVKQRMPEIEEAMRQGSSGGRVIAGISTGIDRLDATIGGLQLGIVTIGCGRPGSGKSAAGLAVTDAATLAGDGVHVFSLEDPRRSYVDRGLSRQSRVPAERLRNGDVRRGDQTPLVLAANELYRRKGWLVDDRSGISAEEVVRSVRRRRRENGTRVVIVDYLQLLRRPRDSYSVHDAISQNVHTLADAAKADDMAYLVFSQLNRELEKREDKRPRLSDLRESGTIEERAKCVLGFHRPRMYDDAADEHLIEIHVLKNSNGESGIWVEARWDGPTTRIDNFSPRRDS
jgi:replicative DNA helicase